MAKKCSSVLKSSKGGNVSNVKRNLKFSYAADMKTLDVIVEENPCVIFRLRNVDIRRKVYIKLKLIKNFDIIYEFLTKKSEKDIILEIIPNMELSINRIH